MRFSEGVKVAFCTALLIFVVASVSPAQQSSTPNGGTQNDGAIKELRTQLQETQSELHESQRQIEDLRTMVLQLRDQLQRGAAPSGTATSAATSVDAEAPPAQTAQAVISADDWQLVNARIEEHQQVKVESGSKFKLKLSGLLLFNAFTTAGNVRNVDVPEFARERNLATSHGTSGASIRQSVFTLTGVGPKLFGAATSGDLQVDFYGGIPAGYSGSSTGIARLRLGRFRMDWEKTSVVAGIDTPFFSPNSPTSYATVAEPGFATAGNQWSWAPSVRIEQRMDAGPVQFKGEAGLLDPVAYVGYRPDQRYQTPGESSRNPAYAVRLSANNRNHEKPMSVGVSGVFTPQWFPLQKSTDGWNGAVDWRTPLLARTELSGEVFVGKAMSGFGGVTLGVPLPSDFHYLYVTAPGLARMKMVGGWSQLKFRIDSRNEINVAAGYGGFEASSLRAASLTDPYILSVPIRNESFMMNYIVRPRSNLLFSVEYRKLRTFNIAGPSETADHVGLAAGFLF